MQAKQGLTLSELHRRRQKPARQAKPNEPTLEQLRAMQGVLLQCTDDTATIHFGTEADDV